MSHEAVSPQADTSSPGVTPPQESASPSESTSPLGATSPQARPAQQGGDAVESALLDATEVAIATYGVSRLSLERVAECAGMSRATIYRRNVTLEGLVDAVLSRAMDSLRATLWSALTGLEPADVRLRAALEAILGATEQHLAALSGLFAAHQPGLDPFHRPGPDGLTLDVFAAPLERLLADGALDGSLRPVEPKVTATVLLSAAVWSYVHLRHSHDWPAERTRDAVLDLTLQGLLPPGERPAPPAGPPASGGPATPNDRPHAPDDPPHAPNDGPPAPNGGRPERGSP